MTTRLESLNLRLTYVQKRALERQATLLEVTPSEIVRRLLDAAADRFQPATLDLDVSTREEVSQ